MTDTKQVRIYESTLETIEELTSDDKPLTARIDEVATLAHAWDQQESDRL